MVLEMEEPATAVDGLWWCWRWPGVLPACVFFIVKQGQLFCNQNSEKLNIEVLICDVLVDADDATMPR